MKHTRPLARFGLKNVLVALACGGSTQGYKMLDTIHLFKVPITIVKFPTTLHGPINDQYEKELVSIMAVDLRLFILDTEIQVVSC